MNPIVLDHSKINEHLGSEERKHIARREELSGRIDHMALVAQVNALRREVDALLANKAVQEWKIKKEELIKAERALDDSPTSWELRGIESNLRAITADRKRLALEEVTKLIGQVAAALNKFSGETGLDAHEISLIALRLLL